MSKNLCINFKKIGLLSFIVSFFIFFNKVEAAEMMTYSRVDYGNADVDKTDYGYMLVPDRDGVYPAVVFIHGLGGLTDDKNEALFNNLQNWVSKGYLDPVLLVVPTVHRYANDDDGTYIGRFLNFANVPFPSLLTRIENGTQHSKIDTTKTVSISGFSLGGATTLYIGHTYRSRVYNIGALSPAAMFTNPAGGWVQTNAVTFSSNANRHLFMAASKTESSGSMYQNFTRYMSEFGNSYGFSTYTPNFGEHNYGTCVRELFSYLYFIQNDSLPSDSLIEEAIYSSTLGVSLGGYSISLDGKIGVNFYMELSADVVEDPSSHMHFTLPDGTTKDVSIASARTETVNGETYYVFQCQVAAKEMASIVKAKFYTADGSKSTEEYSYSVKDYSEYVLAHTSVSEYAQAANLVRSMLNYGAAAQTYFNFNTGTLANVNTVDAAQTQAISNISSSTLSAYAYDSSTENLPSGLSYSGANLELESEVILNLYFTNNTGNDISVSTSSGIPRKTITDDYTKVSISGIPAQNLDTNITINITAGSSSNYSITVNPMNYNYLVLSRNTDGTRTENLKTLMKSLYKYNQEAKSYNS